MTARDKIAFLLLLINGPTLASPCAGQPNGQFKEVRSGVYMAGAITIVAADHSVRFPAEVNMAGGIIEYALVHEGGKVHESLLSTKVSPLELNVALLLARPKQGGTRVRVLIKLSDDASEMPVEKWIRRNDADKLMENGVWAYQGSRLEEGVLVAERDGSILGIIEDRDAVIGNPRDGRENDDIWEAARGDVPKVGTPVEVVIRFEPK